MEEFIDREHLTCAVEDRVASMEEKDYACFNDGDEQDDSAGIFNLEGEMEAYGLQFATGLRQSNKISQRHLRGARPHLNQDVSTDRCVRCQQLSDQVADLQGKLLEQKALNEELIRAKQVLTDEIMDLTRTLFEEANSMVANEARARASIEISRKQLERELEATKEQLKIEKQQLRELREKIHLARTSNVNQLRNDDPLEEDQSAILVKSAYELTSMKDTKTGLEVKARQVPRLKFNYFEDLFPNRRFDSRGKCEGPNANVWDQIAKMVDPESFACFSKFVEGCGTLGEEDFLAHPYIRRVYEIDIVPCLYFELKPKPFVKKIIKTLFNNTFSIEKAPKPSTPSQTISRPKTPEILANSEVTSFTDAKTDAERDDIPPELTISRSQASSPKEEGRNMDRVRGIFSQFTASVTSLPETLMGSITTGSFGNTSLSETNSPSKLLKNKMPYSTHNFRFCSFCGRSIIGDAQYSELEQPSSEHNLYRVRLSDTDEWMAIDAGCRERLVAAGQFYTFMRHLRSGLFSRRPIIELYYDVCMMRRHFFYSRLGIGAMSFFMQSDFEQFLSSLDNKFLTN